MYNPQYLQSNEDPKQKMCINQDSENNQEGGEIQQNSNDPYSQQNPQQHHANTPPHYQNNQQQNNIQQYQAYIQFGPNNADAINQELFHQGQKKCFTIKIVTIWILQILIEFALINIWLTFIEEFRITILCSITALFILRSTINQNISINQRNQVSKKDKILFFIYFVVDIFTDFAFYSIIDISQMLGLTIYPQHFYMNIVFILRFCQFVNLICSMYTLCRCETQLRIRNIILITLVPFFVILIFTYMLAIFGGLSLNGSPNRNKTIWFFLMLLIIWQVIQFVLSFNLIRLINKIYMKQHRLIDINNIYTGFILFKLSYYIEY